MTLYAFNRAYDAEYPKPTQSINPLAVPVGHRGEYDVGIVLGDRPEMLSAAAQIVEAGITLAHIHGGEHTFGALDERWRWAISAIADLHFVAHFEAMSELLGHIPRGAVVEVTGAPGLDDIKNRQQHIGPRVLVVYNPTTAAVTEWAAISAALQWEPDVWWIEPGDSLPAGQYATTHPLRPSLESEEFRNWLGGAGVLVGNSSAGIIEAPSLGIWAVNVGDRQRGRLRAGNVIDVAAEPEQIRSAVGIALGRARYKGSNPYDPYGDGRASERIRNALLGVA